MREQKISHEVVHVIVNSLIAEMKCPFIKRDFNGASVTSFPVDEVVSFTGFISQTIALNLRAWCPIKQPANPSQKRECLQVLVNPVDF